MEATNITTLNVILNYVLDKRHLCVYNRELDVTNKSHDESVYYFCDTVHR